MTGRPSDYSVELGERICAAIAETGGLAAALRTKGDWPAARTVFRWLVLHEGFRQSYARACEAGAEPDAEEMRRIANDPDITSDQKRIMVDVLKWQMARRSPKKWGERQVLAGDPEAPITGLSEAQVEARFTELMQKHSL